MLKSNWNPVWYKFDFFLNTIQAAQADNWWKERDVAVARASGLSLQLAEQRAKMDALLWNIRMLRLKRHGNWRSSPRFAT
jgi:hypothetical protein